jgi:hypothetical protein
MLCEEKGGTETFFSDFFIAPSVIVFLFFRKGFGIRGNIRVTGETVGIFNAA